MSASIALSAADKPRTAFGPRSVGVSREAVPGVPRCGGRHLSSPFLVWSQSATGADESRQILVDHVDLGGPALLTPAVFNTAASIGILRRRLPVAAKIALAMAGTTADVPVSPIPPGGSALLTT